MALVGIWRSRLCTDDALGYTRRDADGYRRAKRFFKLFCQRFGSKKKMKLLGRVHGKMVHSRRVRQLCRHLGELVPKNAKILDVGCGDGMLARLIKERRPDVEVRGIDVFVRENTHIPVEKFDGSHIPY